MPTTNLNKNYSHSIKHLDKKNEYSKISRELDSLKNKYPNYVLWISDNRLSSNEKDYKRKLSNENQTTYSNYIRYIANKINKLDKLVNKHITDN